MKKLGQQSWWTWPTLISVSGAVIWVTLLRGYHVDPVMLWSDRLVLLLLVVVLYVIAYIRTKEHLLAPWREVVHRKMAMVALVVISVYLAIGFIDSIHFRLPLPKTTASESTQYQPRVLSLFDVMVKPLRQRIEHSYSAPFASYGLAKETVELGAGRQTRANPRLKFSGAHLTNPATQTVPDIVKTVFIALISSLLAWTVITLTWVALLAWTQQQTWLNKLQQIWRQQTLVPWRTIFMTIWGVLFVIIALILLSADYHVFGTDKVGQDVLYLSLKSIRTGVLIGTLATLVMLPFAVLLGMMAGYFRGIIDDVIQYVYTTLNSIPFVLLIAAAILSIQVYIDAHKSAYPLIEQHSDLRLVSLCVILGITSWTGLCRLLRGETLKIREVDYIQAATALGVNHLRIMTRHILPNVMHIVLIAVVLDFSGLVLAEAVLSYVGIGVDQSTNSWGNMINTARLELAREPTVWWPLLAAFVMMFTLVLAANLFSDAVRDAFDPKLRRLSGRL